MTGTHDLRRRIRSIKNTSQITKAMQMVASSKMHRAQIKALAGRTYSLKLSEILHELTGKVDITTHPLCTPRAVRKALVLVISPDKGLCGALNSNLYRTLVDPKVTEAKIDLIDATISYATIGKKARQFLLKTGRIIELDFEGRVDPDLSFTLPIARTIIQLYLEKQTDLVLSVYTHFHSTLKQEPRIQQILPVERFQLPGAAIAARELSQPAPNRDIYLLEPNPDRILETIVPHYIESLLYQILLEAAASEHSARMIAMKNATDNALELVDNLTLTYNQLRQDSITREILDIATAGATLV